MRQEEYRKQLKQLIKKYHPDLCKDEYLEKIYTEITIKLNGILNKIRTRNSINENIIVEDNGKTNFSGNNSLVNVSDQSYVYYKMGIKYYKNIHPNRFYKRNTDKTFEPKDYEEQLKILNNIFISFSSAEYYFRKVITEYPKSEWVDDAKEKVELLKKLYKSYENINVEENNQIIDSGKFVKEMGLKIV